MRAAILAALLLAAPAAAQAAPDFSGTWERYPLSSGEAPDPRYVAPPIPDPPLKQPWLAEYQKNQALLASRMKEGQPAGDNYVKCLPDGMPAMMMGMFPMEIFQRDRQINITQEAFNQTRRVYMGETLPKWDEVDPSFYGHSVGHWDGETLVIETTGIKPSVVYRWTPHSEAMRISERIRSIAPDYLEDQVTVTDDYLERPWQFTFRYKRMDGYKLQEYVCEDNRDVIDGDGHHTLRLESDKPGG